MGDLEYRAWKEMHADDYVIDMINFDDCDVTDTLVYTCMEMDDAKREFGQAMYVCFIKPIYQDFVEWVFSRTKVNGKSLETPKIKESIKRKYELL